MKRSGLLTMTMALIISACATAAQPPTSTTPEVGETTTTSTTVPPPAETTTTAAQTTTTAGSSATTTAPATTTTTSAPPPANAELSVAPWFFIDEAGHPNRTGAFLLPVNRRIAHTRAIGRASLEQLFAGPTAAETSRTPAISTTIPGGVKILGLTIREGIAIVDLSAEFDGATTSPVVAQRMAQVVFTLTSIPHLNEVIFHQGGVAIKAQTSDGQLVSRPVLKADYLDFAAALTVESPTYDGQGGNPLHVTGFGTVFEAQFNYALTDANGLIIAEGSAMTTTGTDWGGFDFAIPYELDKKQTGALIVWDFSAANGDRIDIREYPVVLVP